MNKYKSRLKFKITEIERFDARRGYKRCDPPGVGASYAMPRSPTALADFWKDHTGRLVGKFSCQGETFAFEASLVSGAPIQQKQMGAFGDYVSEVLAKWISEGIHEVDGIGDFVHDL